MKGLLDRNQFSISSYRPLFTGTKINLKRFIFTYIGI